MAFYKITHNEKYRFATLHNFGCTFRCPICSYKLRSGADGRPGHAYPQPRCFLTVEEIKQTLRRVAGQLETLYFMGGEPTVAAELPELLDFGKNELGLRTCLGHTNGSKRPMPNLDAANVGIKAWDEALHLDYTSRPKGEIFDNFTAAFHAGMDLRANVVFVPGWVDLVEVEAIAAWLAELDAEIPFHIMGYIPVPGQPFKRPTTEQMTLAETAAKKYLRHVDSSHLDSDEALRLPSRDERFRVKQIA